MIFKTSQNRDVNRFKTLLNLIYFNLLKLMKISLKINNKKDFT